MQLQFLKVLCAKGERKVILDGHPSGGLTGQVLPLPPRVYTVTLEPAVGLEPASVRADLSVTSNHAGTPLVVSFH
jgi:hypothetical protein